MFLVLIYSYSQPFPIIFKRAQNLAILLEGPNSYFGPNYSYSGPILFSHI